MLNNVFQSKQPNSYFEMEKGPLVLQIHICVLIFKWLPEFMLVSTM